MWTKSLSEPLNEVLKGTSSVARGQAIFERRLEDCIGMQMLQPLLTNRLILPWTGSSLRPYCMAHIVNDVIINNRTQLLELGAGVSTLILGRLFKQNRIGGTILSVDHDETWVQAMRQQVANEGLEPFVELLWAPLTDAGPVASTRWYDMDTLSQKIAASQFDLLLVDGPPAWEPGKEMARYPALPFILPRLLPQSAIYLDDAERTGERTIIGRWTHELNIPFRIAGGTLAYSYRGRAYFTEPLSKLAV